MTESAPVRPTSGHAHAGHAAFIAGMPLEECPWSGNLLSGIEWRMGHLGGRLLTARQEGDDEAAQDAAQRLARFIRERDETLHIARGLLPSAQACEAACGLTTQEWSTNPQRVIKSMLEKGLLVKMESEHGRAQGHTGAYWGPVSMSSPYAGASPIKHSWAECASGLVVDPLRWIIESNPPQVWAGNQDHYDAGGVRLRRKLSVSPNPGTPAMGNG